MKLNEIADDMLSIESHTKSMGTALSKSANASITLAKNGAFMPGAEGYVVGAEAKAGVVAGAIQDDGEISYGVSAEASAGAYLAKGEVKLGFTLFGVKIDGSVGGSVGVGVKAGAKVITDSIDISAGLSALLGVDVEVSIDWSDFGL